MLLEDHPSFMSGSDEIRQHMLARDVEGSETWV